MFRASTGAINRYYIDTFSGSTYVTEQVPGIIDDETKTEDKSIDQKITLTQVVVDEIAVHVGAVDVATAALLPVHMPARPHAHHTVRTREKHVARQVTDHLKGVRRLDGTRFLAGTEDLHGAPARAVERGAQLGELTGGRFGGEPPEVNLLALARGGERLCFGERALPAHGLSGIAFADALPGGADGLQPGWRRGRAGTAHDKCGGGYHGTDG